LGVDGDAVGNHEKGEEDDEGDDVGIRNAQWVKKQEHQECDAYTDEEGHDERLS
jgi:hypothetical protein